MTVNREQNMKRQNQQDVTIRCLLLTSVSTCFGHHYVHLQENKGRVTAFGVMFCNKRGNVDISRDVFLCSKPIWEFVCVCEFTHDIYTRHLHTTFTHDIYTRHLHTTFANTHEFPTRFTTQKDITANIYVSPLVTEQHTKCSNRAFVLMKTGIMMPETC